MELVDRADWKSGVIRKDDGSPSTAKVHSGVLVIAVDRFE
jgi:hypothetical protein